MVSPNIRCTLCPKPATHDAKYTLNFRGSIEKDCIQVCQEHSKLKYHPTNSGPNITETVSVYRFRHIR